MTASVSHLQKNGSSMGMCGDGFAVLSLSQFLITERPELCLYLSQGFFP